jgi:hypothetical protein
MGHGWWGIDYHWKARHELEMPFKIFWAGLCESHREFHDDGQRLKTLVEAVPFPVRIPRIIEDAYHKVHSRRSCDIENILVRLLISAIADGLWVRDHRINLQVFHLDSTPRALTSFLAQTIPFAIFRSSWNLSEKWSIYRFDRIFL